MKLSTLLLSGMKSKARIDRWVMVGNTIVGYVFDHWKFKPGTRVQTEAVIDFNPATFDVRCRDGDFKLGEPGTVAEHQKELLKPSFAGKIIA